MKRTIKPICETSKWMFHVDNPMNGLPYINMRDYTIIKQVIRNNKRVDDRVNHLTNRGYKVRRCYVSTYNGIGQPTYLPRKNEIRIIIGRPLNHFSKEVFAVIIEK